MPHPPPDAGLAWPEPGRTLRLVRRCVAGYAAACLAVAAPLLAFPTAPLVAQARSGGLAGLVLGALLLPLAGLAATLPMAWARRAAPAALPRLARQPQGVIVPLLSLAAVAAAWGLRPSALDAGAVLLGTGAIVLTFPLLLAERVMAAVDATRLPEAPALQALLLVPVIVVPLGGLLDIATGLGWGWTRPAMAGLAAYLCLVAAELAVRALANWFLPPPIPTAARASVSSAAALLLQPGRLAPDGLAAPLRTHLGLDFSRSWALRYTRIAVLPVAMSVALLGWGLSGVTLVNLDARGVYERFGVPAAVWQPGAHLGLPWPFGRVRLVELGAVHTVTLGAETAMASTAAEDPVPLSADRLWDQPHPAEVSYVVASVDSAGAQGFGSVSVDMRVLYGAGADDASALRAAYAVASPGSLVRTEAGRLLARFFAGQTLDAVLGGNREALAGSLRAALQAQLDRQGAGIALHGVVIEAIHPPPTAAEAYHNVQAAQIVADTAVATERGRAQATAAMARQVSTGLTDAARGGAAETAGGAEAQARSFAADRDAASAGGQAFLLERYFANFATALAKSPLVVVDHRLRGPGAPVIDLRPFGAPGGRPADDD